MGPGLSSTLPPNNIKTLYTHVAIHILVMATKKRKRLSDFGSIIGVMFNYQGHCYE